jgi:hypothetical protein
MRRLSYVAVVLAVGLGLGCASSGGSSSQTVGGDQSLLTGAELDQQDWRNCYEAVETLRPFWLIKRGARDLGDAGQIWVYEGNVRLGGIEALRGINASNVAVMHFLSSSTANQRWGAGHEHGVILVETRR